MAERYETVMSLLEALGDYDDEQPVLLMDDEDGELYHLRLYQHDEASAPVLVLGRVYQGEA